MSAISSRWTCTTAPATSRRCFRNRLTGTEPGKTQWGNTTAVNIWAFNRSVNIVGNVLGTPGYHRIYEDSPSPQATRGWPELSVYVLGFSGSGEHQPLGNDPLVVSTMLRWGNYDYATNQTHWNPDEVPAGHPVPTQVVARLALSFGETILVGRDGLAADRT